MKKTVWILFGGLLLVSPSAFAGLNVLTTTTTLKSIVEAVGKEQVEVQSITKGPQDPHFVEAKPSYILKARNADLIVSVGLDLEVGWLPNIIRGARKPYIMKGSKGYLEVGELIEPIEVPRGKVDRSQGDIHALGNPHFVLDPVRVGRAAKGIAQRLGELNPKGRSRYLKNAESFVSQLSEKLKEWRQRIKISGVKHVITYHKTLNYFLNQFGLELAGSIEPKPGIPPTAKHILHLIRSIRRGGARCILVESFFETNAAKRIKKAVPVHIEIVPTEVEAIKGASDYESLIESLVRAIENCGKFMKKEIQ